MLDNIDEPIVEIGEWQRERLRVIRLQVEGQGLRSFLAPVVVDEMPGRLADVLMPTRVLSRPKRLAVSFPRPSRRRPLRILREGRQHQL